MLILGTVVFAYDVVRKRFVLRSVTRDESEGLIPSHVLAEDDD